jgi:DNA-binding transcriptional MerR regulator
MATLTRNSPSIPHTSFDLDAVARVTGLSASQLQRWDRSGFFRPSQADPNRRRPGSRIYSREDLVALRTIAKLREAGVPLRRIKTILDLMQPDENGNWPARGFWVVADRVYLSPLDAEVAAGRSGQMHGPATLDLTAVVADVTEAMARLSERRPEEIGRVVRRRGIMRGVPIIAGTRIPTKTVAWFHGHGYSLTEILDNYPRLTPRDVEAAIAFECERATLALEPALAHD